MSNHETHDIIPTLAQAFDAFNKSADKLSVAYKQLVAKDIEPMAQSGELSSSPLLLGALECVPGGVIVIDREYSVVAVNTAAQELTGLSANDVAGEFCQDVFENTLKTGTSKRRRKRMSSDIEVEIHTSPVADNNGNIIGAVGILGQQGQGDTETIALSPHPRVAASPRHSLAPMLTAIGDIIMNIAHRMRSPLNAIQLFAELLKQDLDEDKQEMVDDILIGVYSLDAVLCNLLSFSQPVNPRFQEVDLAAVLNESLLFAAPAITQKGISLIKESSHDQLYCSGDLEQLKQVCFNLILNAIQAMPDGGELRIKASYNKSTTGNCVDVEIADNGSGIASELMERIFTPFFTTKEGSTGLGLCIVYRVIEAHHGTIQIDSVEGRGTTVSIRIPTELLQEQC